MFLSILSVSFGWKFGPVAVPSLWLEGLVTAAILATLSHPGTLALFWLGSKFGQLLEWRTNSRRNRVFVRRGDPFSVAILMLFNATRQAAKPLHTLVGRHPTHYRHGEKFVRQIWQRRRAQQLAQERAKLHHHVEGASMGQIAN